MRSGRMRRLLRTSSRIVTWPRPSTLAGRDSSRMTWLCCSDSSAASSMVTMRSPLGDERRQRVEQCRLARAGAAGHQDVEPGPDAGAEQGGRGRVEGAAGDELIDRERPRELADGDHGAIEGERRQDDVDALAGAQAGVDHRAGLVDPAVDRGDDAVDGLEQLLGADEALLGQLDATEPLDEDAIGTVDHDLGDRRRRRAAARARRARGPRPRPADQRRAFTAGQQRTAAGDQVRHDPFETGAALGQVELGELGEIDLVEQLLAEVGDEGVVGLLVAGLDPGRRFLLAIDGLLAAVGRREGLALHGITVSLVMRRSNAGMTSGTSTTARTP